MIVWLPLMDGYHEKFALGARAGNGVIRSNTNAGNLYGWLASLNTIRSAAQTWQQEQRSGLTIEQKLT